MKHLLRYSLMCILSILCGTTFAQTEVKFDFDNGDAALFGLPGVSCNADEANGIAESHDGDFTQDATATKDGVSITVSAAEEGAKNANRIWNKSAVLRMYSGSLTIEAPGHKITKLVINYSKDKWQADSKPDVGAFISSTDQTTIWSGSSSKVVIKIAGNSQMKDITVTLDGESGGQGSGDTNYGTAEAPLTVAEALTIATALEADAKTPDDVDVYTKGVVTEITTAWSSQYNNVSFNISNDGGTINLLVYRCKAETEDYVLVGDEVIIKGKLKNYKGNTPEYDAGCEIVSLVPGDGHDTTPHTDVKFDFDNGDAALFGLPGVSCNADEENGIAESHDGDFTQDATATKDGVSITVSVAEEGAKNANRIWNKSAVLRMYSGSLTIEAPGHKITKLVINYSKDKWQADSKPDVGAFISSTNQTTIWSGSSSKVVIKIAGNSQMKDITVTLDGESGGQGSGDTNYGTAEAPLTVAEALTIATALEADAKTPDDVDVYTKGVVTEITTAWSSQYNNVSFNISNDGGNINLLVYRCKSEAEDYVLVGDEVIIKGKLKNYKGNTPEYDAGCEIVSLVPGDGHDTTPHTDVKFDFDNGDAALFGLPGVSCNADEANGIPESHDGDFTQDATATKDGVSITVSAAEEGAKNANRIWNKSAVLRMYSGSLTIEAPEHTITKVVINYSKDKWQADSKPDVGAFTSSTDQTTIWEGSSSKIVIKIAGNSQMKDITVTLDGESGGQGSGDTNYGTAEAPLTVAEAIAAAIANGDTASKEDYYVKGKICSIKYEYSAQYGTATYNISEDGSEGTEFTVYSSYYFDNKSWQDGDTQIKVGDEVIVCGKIINYNGNTPEFASKQNYLISLNGKTSSGTSEDPEAALNHGTADAPLTVADAIAAAEVVGTKASTGDFYVKGKICSIKYEYSAEYGTATYNISEDGSEGTEFTVYSSYYLDNKKWQEGDNQIAVGDEVIVCGKIINYNGNTPEFASKQNYLVALNKATGIQNVKISKANGAIYNLAGQQVEKATKGIYIQNGKKFIVK